MQRTCSRAAAVVMCAALVTSCDGRLAADGRVSDSSGAPISGALVQLTWGRDRASVDTSDASGDFVVDHSHGLSWPNRGTLTVCKAGYQPWRMEISEVEAKLRVEVRMTPDPGRSHSCS